MGLCLGFPKQAMMLLLLSEPLGELQYSVTGFEGPRLSPVARVPCSFMGRFPMGVQKSPKKEDGSSTHHHPRVTPLWQT